MPFIASDPTVADSGWRLPADRVASSRRAGYSGFMKTFPALYFGIVLAASPFARADQIEMQNGDRYNGKLLAMTNATLVLQSEILGVITIPREKVNQISLGEGVHTNSAKRINSRPAGVQSKALLPGTGTAAGVIGATNPPATAASADDKKLMAQVQDQFLAGAGPEAVNKYNNMVNGFLSGQLSLGDIRAQAKSAADQLRAARKDLGEDGGIALDGYLAILDSFLKETASDAAKPAAPTPAAPKPRPESGN
jgi:hypothetical protein